MKGHPLCYVFGPHLLQFLTHPWFSRDVTRREMLLGFAELLLSLANGHPSSLQSAMKLERAWEGVKGEGG